MLVAFVFAAVCCNVAFSYDIPPLPEKNVYDIEDACNLFLKFIKEYGRSYSRHEYSERLQIFKKSLKEINELNAKYPDTVFGVTHFADLTEAEKQHYFGFKPSNGTIAVKPKLSSKTDVPDSFDWRDKNAVTHVKNQGRCGSCYIFSAIGNIEGQYAIKHQQCVALSEQQVLDCIPDCTCGGGFPEKVMQELAKDSSACMKEDDYQYVGEEQTCLESKSKQFAIVKGGKTLDLSDEEKAKQILVETGPLSIGLNAEPFQHYTGGVFPGAGCGTPLDHALVLVGYGEDNGKKFWTIKNSWAESWGEKGYLRLERGVHACGFGDYAATAEVV